MTEYEPNERQQELIDATNGIHVVDAGAGTGKTFTITRRYANLLEQGDVEPEDILLITFTNNAAGEMKERVVANCDYSMSALRDAPINTFHGYCHDLLIRHGFDARRHVSASTTGLRRRRNSSRTKSSRKTASVSSSTSSSKHIPSTTTTSGTLNDATSLLDLIKELAAKGVFPTDEGGSATASPSSTATTRRSRRSSTRPTSRTRAQTARLSRTCATA